MNPFIMQQVAETRAIDLRKQAAASWRARRARRARRGRMTAQHGI